MLKRIFGVLRLDSGTFQEIASAGQGATVQAAIIVFLTGVMGGVNIFFIGLGFAMIEAIRNGIIALITWIFFSLVTYFIGTRLFTGRGTVGGMLRVMGFAYSPYLLIGVADIAVSNFELLLILSCVIFVWQLLAHVMSIREGLHLDTGRVILLIIVEVIVLALGMMMLFLFGIAIEALLVG